MTSQAKKAWAAFTTAFFAFLAMLGFAPATAVAATAATAGTAASGGAAVPAATDLTALPGRTAAIPAGRTSPEAADPAPALLPAWWAQPKDRSLPPTIKQRIRAEAHGSTPGIRHRPLDSDTTSDEMAGAAAVGEAAVGEAVLQPA